VLGHAGFVVSPCDSCDSLPESVGFELPLDSSEDSPLDSSLDSVDSPLLPDSSLESLVDWLPWLCCDCSDDPSDELSLDP
jgi:hypothetical protein